MAINGPNHTSGMRKYIDVTGYGAVGNRVTDDTAAIQAAIDAAADRGSPRPKGGVVFLPPGDYIISSPLVLPRNGNDISSVVWLTGANLRATRIRGSAAFPVDRGMIEWEATTARIWHGKISNLCLTLPNVSGVRGIYHKANQGKGNITTVAQVKDEWMQCDFENLLIEGSNMYHEVLIDLEIGNREAKFVNVFGAPCPGEKPTYDTLLIRTPTSVFDGTRWSDAAGIGFSTLENVHGMIYRDGRARNFEGRIYHSEVRNMFCNGGKTGPAYKFMNGVGVNFYNIRNEGKSESSQIHIENCQGYRFENFGLGTPDAIYPKWAARSPYKFGDVVISPSLTGNHLATSKKYFTCTVRGISSGSEPIWPTVDGNIVVDGTVTWQVTGDALGDGLVLVASKNNIFSNRDSGSGILFSNRLVKVIKTDANCSGNRFTDIVLTVGTAGDPNPEIDILGTDESISGFTQTGTVKRDDPSSSYTYTRYNKFHS